MRFARPAALALLLTLALAPAASAHGDDDPNHRDTPKELAAADISRTLAIAHLAQTVAPDLPEYLPTTWCGTERSTDDIADAAFPSSQRQIKVVYVYATDQPHDFDRWKDALQADVSRIEQFLALQTGGRRALRFDMGTDCGPQYLDIQSVALPHDRSYYIAGDDETNFFNLAADVHAVVGNDTRDVFVLGDGLTTPGAPTASPDQGVWGIAQVSPDDRMGNSNESNSGGLTGMMLTPPGTNPDPVDWQPTVMLHEITHNLGGVQQSAPHSTPFSHCWDGRDVMCYADGSTGSQPYTTSVCDFVGGAIPQTYDCDHDDYFSPDPAPGSYLATHWNVYTSAFMGTCSQLGMACGSHIVTTVPVNTALPTVTGSAQRGAVLAASTGTWFNTPQTYLAQWQRATATGWVDIAGATQPSYMPAAADVGAALRVLVTAVNDDGSAVAASGPTAAVADFAIATPPPVKAKTPTTKGTLKISLRDLHRHKAGTLAARVTAVKGGREVRTSAAVVALPAGTWRLKLCAGPKRGALRCGLSARVRTRKAGVRLPSAHVVVRSPSGVLRVTAAAVDARQRIRATGQAATA
jgi:hypothetical protein